jgi:hypothetical protein
MTLPTNVLIRTLSRIRLLMHAKQWKAVCSGLTKKERKNTYHISPHLTTGRTTTISLRRPSRRWCWLLGVAVPERVGALPAPRILAHLIDAPQCVPPEEALGEGWVRVKGGHVPRPTIDHLREVHTRHSIRRGSHEESVKGSHCKCVSRAEAAYQQPPRAGYQLVLLVQKSLN